MHHCVEFSACDIWQLKKNDDFIKRQVNIGFCPVCGKAVAELVERTKDGLCYILPERIKSSVCIVFDDISVSF